ncbi:unnamed protein product, partial [Rotaria sordida]
NSGHPSIDDACPDLLATIEEIASFGVADDDRRRIEVIRGYLTLGDLLENKHEDSHFTAATIGTVKDIVSLFGNDSIFLLSQDDTCKVSLGLLAAKKQAPLLMHFDYVIQLLDHDFAVAPCHQLTPSVCTAYLINITGDVGYSGPKYIAIRSAKHDKSISTNHRDDFGHLVKLQEKAGEVLAEIWSNTIIDSHPVMTSYVNISLTSQTSSYINEQWCDRHVVQSQYTLQIVRYDSKTRCDEWRSKFPKIFPPYFLSPLVPFARNSSDLVSAANDSKPRKFYGSLFQRLQLNRVVCEEIESDSIPFDCFCTTVQQSLSKQTYTQRDCP